jgi:hypothetical protein
VARWRLTVRHGPRVEREAFDDLHEALASVRRHAAAVVSEGRLEPVQGFKEYEAGDQVAARIELSTGRLFNGREAGVDVMGDGTLVPYRGVVRKERLDGRTPDAALDAVRRALG